MKADVERLKYPWTLTGLKRGSAAVTLSAYLISLSSLSSASRTYRI